LAGAFSGPQAGGGGEDDHRPVNGAELLGDLEHLTLLDHLGPARGTTSGERPVDDELVGARLELLGQLVERYPSGVAGEDVGVIGDEFVHLAAVPERRSRCLSAHGTAGTASNTAQRVEATRPLTRSGRLARRAWAGHPVLVFPQTSASLYELAVRESDGIEVALLWDGAADRVLLHVRDARSGEWFVSTVDGAHALDAFRHPFAYAAPRNDRPQHARPAAA
jgi:hypothetical protein